MRHGGASRRGRDDDPPVQKGVESSRGDLGGDSNHEYRYQDQLDSA